MQNFNVTKEISIALSNSQITALREMSRAKAALFLNINESQARKVVDAIKSGAIKEIEEVKVPAASAAKGYTPKDAATLDNTNSIGVFLRQKLDVITKLGENTVDAAYELATQEFGDELKERLPEGKKFSTFVKTKLRDAFGREGLVQVGSGKKAVWVRN